MLSICAATPRYPSISVTNYRLPSYCDRFLIRPTTPLGVWGGSTHPTNRTKNTQQGNRKNQPYHVTHTHAHKILITRFSIQTEHCRRVGWGNHSPVPPGMLLLLLLQSHGTGFPSWAERLSKYGSSWKLEVCPPSAPQQTRNTQNGSNAPREETVCSTQTVAAAWR